MILGKSLYNFMYNRKYSLFHGKSLQFPNFVFVEKFLSIRLLNCRAFLFHFVEFAKLLVMLQDFSFETYTTCSKNCVPRHTPIIL